MRISDWSSDVCSSDLFRGYSGGHGKVWDYFNHALAAGWDARVYFTPQSLHDASNPWSAMPERVLDRYAPNAADALFIGGMDRSEEHTSELQSLMRISYAVFCLKKNK